jgi:hypothetical protein
MRRPLFILIGLLTVAAAVFAGSFLVSRQICMKEVCNPADDLAWLREEFHLSDTEIAHVRQLHEGYMPKCAEMCARIAAKKREVEIALNGVTNINSEAEIKLKELGELRAQCQAQMLQHFVEVSRAMPSDQGQRYLAEMQRLTIGGHEQIEQTMSNDHAGHEHQH